MNCLRRRRGERAYGTTQRKREDWSSFLNSSSWWNDAWVFYRSIKIKRFSPRTFYTFDAISFIYELAEMRTHTHTSTPRPSSLTLSLSLCFAKERKRIAMCVCESEYDMHLNDLQSWINRIKPQQIGFNLNDSMKHKRHSIATCLNCRSLFSSPFRQSLSLTLFRKLSTDKRRTRRQQKRVEKTTETRNEHEWMANEPT